MLTTKQRDKIRAGLIEYGENGPAGNKREQSARARKFKQFANSSRHFDRFVDKMWSRFEKSSRYDVAATEEANDREFLKFIIDLINQHPEIIAAIIDAIIRLIPLLFVLALCLFMPPFANAQAPTTAVKVDNPLAIPTVIPIVVTPSDPTNTNANVPSFRLTYKESVKAGRMLVMKIEGVPPESEIGYITAPPFPDEGFQLHDNGHTVNATSPAMEDGSPARYIVIATANNPEPNKAPLRFGCIIEFSGGTVPPHNPDVPTPVDVPDDKYGNVGRAAYSAAMKLTSQQRKHSVLIGELYESAADQLDDGDLINATEALTWIGTERNKITGSDADAWRSVVSEIGSIWEVQWKKNGSLTKFQVAEFFRAVAVGLKAVK